MKFQSSGKVIIFQKFNNQWAGFQPSYQIVNNQLVGYQQLSWQPGAFSITCQQWYIHWCVLCFHILVLYISYMLYFNHSSCQMIPHYHVSFVDTIIFTHTGPHTLLISSLFSSSLPILSLTSSVHWHASTWVSSLKRKTSIEKKKEKSYLLKMLILTRCVCGHIHCKEGNQNYSHGLESLYLSPHSFMFLWWAFQVCEVISKGFFFLISKFLKHS